MRENCDLHCEICDFVAKSKKRLKVQKTKTHIQTIETQTRTLKVFVHLRYIGRYVSDSEERYITKI